MTYSYHEDVCTEGWNIVFTMCQGYTHTVWTHNNIQCSKDFGHDILYDYTGL